MKKKVLINNARILITGGTGSWGYEITSQLLTKYPKVKEIVIYSRGEYHQVQMKNDFRHHKKIRFIIGDIRNKEIMQYAMRNIDIVFHLAALKHVPICEENTWEAVLTNIVGTQNVIEAAIATGVKKVVSVSTDKAVEPFNLYGVTKACGEKLTINSNFNYPQNQELPDFICVRGGNVIGTNGSVIPLFKKQLEEDNCITITDPTMTRFLMNKSEAISLVLKALETSIGGELFVMRMPAASVATIAKVMIMLYGNSSSKMNVIGKRPGEKMHEVLISKHEMPLSYKVSNDYYVVLPQIQDKALYTKYSSLPKLEEKEFTSLSTTQLTEKALEKMIRKEKEFMI